MGRTSAVGLALAFLLMPAAAQSESRGAIPPAPRNATLFQTARGATALANLTRRIGPPLASAEWVEIETLVAGEGADARPPLVTDRGWLVEAGPDGIAIETPAGYRKQIPAVERVRNEDVRHRHRRADVGREAERVEALRAKLSLPESRPASVQVEVRPSGTMRDHFDLRGELSDCCALSSQFEPFEWSLYEVILAYRLWQAGRQGDAARLLAPLMDAVPDPTQFDELVQLHLGNALAHQMIARFCEHDLARTLTLARRVESDLPHCQFAALAARLAAEIPLREGDWTEFRLPTIEEWWHLAAQLDRDAQIRYLCAQLRLLTAVGSMRGPVRISPARATQTCEPGRADHRATVVSGGCTEVINPLQLLSRGPLPPRPDGSGTLGADRWDIPLLRSCAANDWLCPCVHFSRPFAAPRTVSTTAELLRSLIDGINR